MDSRNQQMNMTSNWRSGAGLATWVIPIALTAAALILRLSGLHELAPGLASDEGYDGLLALELLQGRHEPVFEDREGLGIYAMALSIKVLGRTPLALRLPAALASVSTVFVIFWLGQLLFGLDESRRETRWRGLFVGAVASCLMTISLGQTILGRTSYRGNFLPLFLALCLACLWWGWTRRRWWGIVLAGACAGVLPYTYSPARFTPFLFLFFGISFLLPIRSSTWKKMRTELQWAAVFTGVAGLVATPIIFHYIRNPELFFNERMQVLFIFSDVQDATVVARARILAANVWEHISALSFRLLAGCCSPFDHAVTLNMWEAFFFWLGVGTAVWQWKRRPAYRLLLLWVGLLLLPAFLSTGGSTMRMVGAVPAIYLLVASGMWEIFQWSASRMPVGTNRWRFVCGGVISLAVVFQGAVTYQTYFGKGMADHYFHYDMIWPRFAQMMNARPTDIDTAYFIPHVHHGFEYLYLGETPVRMFWPYVPELEHQIEEGFAEIGQVSTVKVVDWVDSFTWGGSYHADFLSILLGKNGTYIGREDFEGVFVNTYVDVSHAYPWTLFDDLPRPLVFDGGIILNGLTLDSSKATLPGQHVHEEGQDRALMVGMLWQTASEPAGDYSISLRLYNVEGTMISQTDHVLREPTNYASTTRFWPAHEPVEILFQHEVPNEITAGEYELRMVVYDLTTLEPTVEVGIWEPETVLGRMQLHSSQ